MNIYEKFTRFVQGTAIALTLSFLVVGYAPEISFGAIKFPSYGIVDASENTVNFMIGDPGDPILHSGRDFDGDGYFDSLDDCWRDWGTSTEIYTGCPDDDGDGYSNKKDVCPHNTDHKSCLTGKGLAVYPQNDELWTCWDMLMFENELWTAEILAFTTVGLGTLIAMFIPGINIVVVKLLVGGAATLGIVGGSMWESNRGSAARNVESVRGIVGCR